jgi:hypothetical protein
MKNLPLLALVTDLAPLKNSMVLLAVVERVVWIVSLKVVVMVGFLLMGVEEKTQWVLQSCNSK